MSTYTNVDKKGIYIESKSEELIKISTADSPNNVTFIGYMALIDENVGPFLATGTGGTRTHASAG